MIFLFIECVCLGISIGVLIMVFANEAINRYFHQMKGGEESGGEQKHDQSGKRGQDQADPFSG